MTNTERLKIALQERHITIDQASKRIGVNPSTFYRKMSRDCDTFTVAEVGELVKMMNLDSKSMQDIFFSA